MGRKIFLTALALTLFYTNNSATAQNYLISVPNEMGLAEEVLTGYPGIYWGRSESKIYLSGNGDELSWLDSYGINYQTNPIDPNVGRIFICYFDNIPDTRGLSGILDATSEYVVSLTPMPGASFYRQLLPGMMPSPQSQGLPEITVTYDPLIDSLMGEVNQDTVYDFLRMLTGEDPIEIDGVRDTLFTRNSWLPESHLAARFLSEKLDDYGYQVTTQGVYGIYGSGVSAYDANKAWVSTNYGDILTTTDGGNNWQVWHSDYYNFMGIVNVCSSMVWVTDATGAILFSSDGGTTFGTLGSGTGCYLKGISFIDSSRGWIAHDQGILHTTDGGTTWSNWVESDGRFVCDIDFVDSLNGWAVGWGGLILHSTNGGADWEIQPWSSSDLLVGIDFIDTQKGWAVGSSTYPVVTRTADGGQHWRRVNISGLGSFSDVSFADSLHGCIVGNYGHIYMTSDGGNNWHESGPEYGDEYRAVRYIDSLTAFVTGSNLLLKTTDAGQTWIDQMGGVEISWRNVIAIKPGTIMPDNQAIICAHYDCRAVNREDRAPGADDNGSGTAAVMEAARILSDIDFPITVKFCLWVGEEQGLMGSSYYASRANLRGDRILGVFNYDMLGWDGDDDDSVEIRCGTMPSSQRLGQLLADVMSEYSIFNLHPMLDLTDDGRSDHASFWDFNYPAICGIEDYSGDFNPFYHTSGDSLQTLDANYMIKYIKAAVGAVATFALDTANASGVDSPRSLPNGFVLYANYPNPFNPTTTISYNLPLAAHVTLEIYDILGRKVETLVDKEQPVGSHQAVWNAGDRASGIYFYRIQAGDIIDTKRMLLLK